MKIPRITALLLLLALQHSVFLPDARAAEQSAAKLLWLGSFPEMLKELGRIIGPATPPAENTIGVMVGKDAKGGAWIIPQTYPSPKSPLDALQTTGPSTAGFRGKRIKWTLTFESIETGPGGAITVNFRKPKPESIHRSVNEIRAFYALLLPSEKERPSKLKAGDDVIVEGVLGNNFFEAITLFFGKDTNAGKVDVTIEVKDATLTPVPK